MGYHISRVRKRKPDTFIMSIKNFNYVKSFLFENKTLKQTIFKNTFWLGVSHTIDRLLRLTLLIYVARILGATEYGKFTFVLSFVSLFAIFHEFGLRTIVGREFARNEEKKEEFYSVISLKILLSLGTLVLILLSSFFISSDPEIKKIIIILGIFSLINGFTGLIYAFFHALRRMEYRAWLEILEAILVTSIGLFVIFNFPSLENLSYGYLISGFLVLLSVLAFFHFKIFPLKICWQKPIWRKFLVMAWPLALVGFFGTLHSYIDSVMMGYWGMMTETGWYNAAYRIINVTLIPGILISRSVFPMLSKFFKESKEIFRKTWDLQMEWMIFFAIPLVVGGIFFAPKIIYAFYPDTFAPSILVFQILIITTGIISFYHPFRDLLVASDHQKKFFEIAAIGALINIISNLILIPKYSLYGAAIATVIASIFVLLMYFRYAIKFTSIRLFQLKFLFTFILAVISSLLMYFVTRQPMIYNLNIFLSVIIGITIYFSAFFGLNFISKSLKLYAFNE